MQDDSRVWRRTDVGQRSANWLELWESFCRWIWSARIWGSGGFWAERERVSTGGGRLSGTGGELRIQRAWRFQSLGEGCPRGVYLEVGEFESV